MRKGAAVIAIDGICITLIVCLLGCSVAWEPMCNGSVSDEVLIPTVARIVDEQWSVVSPVLESELGPLPLQSDMRETSIGTIATQEILHEMHGKTYVQFCHAVASGTNTDVVISLAKELVDEDSFDQLTTQIEQVERAIILAGEADCRALPPSQKAAFLRDLQKLVTKTVVLMVAGIVYACIPDVVFWGKVTAASAIAVATGIVATTIMSLYRYYQCDSESLSSSFQDWIIDVTTDPAAAYALATSMITVGKTMTNGPVVTGLIIVVFSIYQVMDMVKPMLKKYNFNA